MNAVKVAKRCLILTVLSLSSLVMVACERNEPANAPANSASPDSALPGADDSANSSPLDAASIEELSPDRLSRIDMSGLLDGALRVAIGDVTGDGVAELVVADASRLRVHRADGELVAEAPVERTIQVLRVSQLHGEPAIVTGWGRGPRHPEAAARISLFRFDEQRLDEDLVMAPQTERAEIVDIIPLGDELVVSWFESKFMVETVRATKQGDEWSFEPLDVTRLATSHVIGDVDHDGEADHVIGRVYGDDIGIDGDAFVLDEQQQRPVPTLRGVRGLALGDLDKDGKNEIYLGDGWHQNYRGRAEARLSRSRWSGSEFHTELIDEHDKEGEYTVWDIFTASVDSEQGDDALVVRTNLGVYVYLPADQGWARVALGGPYTTIAVGDVDGEPGDEVLLVGADSHRISLTEIGRK